MFHSLNMGSWHYVYNEFHAVVGYVVIFNDGTAGISIDDPAVA